MSDSAREVPRQQSNEQKRSAVGSPKVIDLYSGVGGFSLGAVRAGFEVVLGVDNDRDLTYSFSVNFPGIDIKHRDLGLLQPNQLLKLAKVEKGELAGIIGGPPCQGFSYIGKRNPDDPRNSLVTRFFEFVAEAQPAFFVLENVPGILSDNFVDVLDRGKALIDNSYTVLPNMCLEAGDYGAATTRPRIFVVGYRSNRVDELTEEDFRSARSCENASVEAAISDLPSPDTAQIDGDGDYWASYERDAESAYARRARALPPEEFSREDIRTSLESGKISGIQPTLHTETVKLRFAKVPPGGIDKISRCRRLTWKERCPTIRAGTGREHGSYQALRPVHPAEDRVITVREAARIQGFPDWFQFHPTKWHSFRMIGNSVSPYVSESLLSTIYGRLKARSDRV